MGESLTQPDAPHPIVALQQCERVILRLGKFDRGRECPRQLREVARVNPVLQLFLRVACRRPVAHFDRHLNIAQVRRLAAAVLRVDDDIANQLIEISFVSVDNLAKRVMNSRPMSGTGSWKSSI